MMASHIYSIIACYLDSYFEPIRNDLLQEGMVQEIADGYTHVSFLALFSLGAFILMCYEIIRL